MGMVQRHAGMPCQCGSRRRVVGRQLLGECQPRLLTTYAGQRHSALRSLRGNDYNRSKDGSKFPIHLNAHERADLLAFLDIL